MLAVDSSGTARLFVYLLKILLTLDTVIQLIYFLEFIAFRESKMAFNSNVI